MQLNALADQVVVLVKNALGPLVERIAGLEARLSVLGDLRDRVVTMETKAAMPMPAPSQVDLGPILQRLATLEIRHDMVADHVKGIPLLFERIADLQARAPVPGPPGTDGRDGAPGQNGAPGRDGLAGLSFEGVYQDGKSYDLGHLVTWAGSSWHCNEPTTTKPGDGSKAWTLMVKRGRDGRDGHDAPGALPVVSVGRPQ